MLAFDISEDGLVGTAKLASDAGTGQRLTTGRLDVGSEAEVVREVDLAVNRLGGLDVLVNAAGIQASAHTHELRLQDWNRILTVNLTGTFLMTRQALPQLLDSGRGVVVNFTSTSASFSHPYMAAYSASKGGIASFTHVLALEYAGRGLRAVNIQPGGIATPLTKAAVSTMPDGFDPRLYMKQQPILNGGRLGEPDAVASVVAMVASDDGKSITGTEIRIDGGAHA